MFVFTKAISQNIIIRGKADKSYSGKVIQLFSLSDYITNIKQKEDQDTIQQDGFFELHFQSDFTQPVFLRIQNVTAKLYVQPDFVYGITIPEVDKEYDYNNDAELPVNIGIVGADSTELNVLTFDFQKQFNAMFDAKDGRFLSRTMMFKRADTLKLICDNKYKTIKNWKNGGHFVDSMGQWAHPGDITTIPSNDITMRGVDYDVMGISNTGDKKLMKPGKNYKFDGDYVTEYPKGGWLNKYK